MNTGLIAGRYATALLGFAEEKKSAELVYKEAKTVTSQYLLVPELRSALESPVLPESEKQKIIYAAAGNKVSGTFEKFVGLVLDNKRENHLQNILLKYIDIYRKKQNIHYAKLITALPVDKSTENRLMNLVHENTGGTVEFEKHTDKEILGGFILEVDFLRWDASIYHQLQQIKNEYISKNKRTLNN